MGHRMARFRSRYGNFGCSGAGLEVFGLGTIATMPISRIQAENKAAAAAGGDDRLCEMPFQRRVAKGAALIHHCVFR